MVPFLGRQAELAELKRLWDAPGPQVHVLFGRRRVGKTALLRHFLADLPHVFYQATEGSLRDNMASLLEQASTSLARPALAAAHPTDIERALGLIVDAWSATAHPGDRLGLVLDEVPNLFSASPASASLLQRFVDALPPSSPVRLFLCGSAVRVMEAEVLGQRSPLYGRRTGQLRLGPLPFAEWSPFCPSMTPRERLWLHAATGGVPAYLVPVEGATSAPEALQALFFRRTSLLLPEADFLLRAELSVLHGYASALRAVAGGATRLQEIAERVGTDGRAVSRYLATLMELGYLARETSLDEPAPEKSRKGRYRVADGLLRFHFRFVHPHRDVIERGDGADLFEQRVLPHLPTFAGPTYEDVTRERLAREAKLRFGSAALHAGRLYGPWGEIDLALELMDGTWVVGECKATAAPIGTDRLDDLKAKVAAVPALKGQRVRLTLASLSGFTPALEKRMHEEGVEAVGE